MWLRQTEACGFVGRDIDGFVGRDIHGIGKTIRYTTVDKLHASKIDTKQQQTNYILKKEGIS